MSHEDARFPEVAFYRLKDVLRIVPVSRSSWYRGIDEGRFPKPVAIGKRSVAYRKEDIDRLVQSLGNAQG